MLRKVNKCIAGAIILMMSCMQAADADDGAAVTLSGNVKASPCTVDASTKPVNLGVYYTGTMATEGEYVKFSVTLSSCPASTTVATATFSGSPDSSSPESYYANITGVGAATGIHIELATGSSPVKGLGNGKTMTADVDSNHKVEFKLQARVNKGASTPKPGVIQTTVNIIYEYA